MKSIMRRAIVLVLAACLGCDQPSGRDTSPAIAAVRPLAAEPVETGRVALPNGVASVKFAVIGDSGRGTPPQYDVSAQMAAARAAFPFTFVIMLGDNIYEGPATADDYRTKFEAPYQPLIDAGVKFYAVLGNHDDPNQVRYAPFHMNGHRYYTFSPPEDPLTRLNTSVRFFAIDTTSLDGPQLSWLDRELGESRSDWKICFFHHPLYTSGRYRQSANAFRFALEPLFVANGVDVGFSGHEHFYERFALQNGIQYFISGGAGSLRIGDSAAAPFVARRFDEDYHFMLVEIDGESLSFQAITRKGETIDSGVLVPNR